jgi:hypothetical protein
MGESPFSQTAKFISVLASMRRANIIGMSSNFAIHWRGRERQ